MPEIPNVGSTLPRRQLGRYLVDWRTRAGYTQVKAAQLLEMGATSLNRLEKGETGRIKNMVIQAICDLYNVPPDLAEAFKGLAQQANVKSWWHQYGDLIPKNFDVYVGLETAATQIITYQPDLIPGLLQTVDYNRSLVELAWPDETFEQWEQRVQIKTQRQRIVTRKTQPVQLNVVIGEAALHRVARSRAIMADQLRHLADVSTRDNVTVRVLPFEAGFPDGASGIHAALRHPELRARPRRRSRRTTGGLPRRSRRRYVSGEGRRRPALLSSAREYRGGSLGRDNEQRPASAGGKGA